MAGKPENEVDVHFVPMTPCFDDVRVPATPGQDQGGWISAVEQEWPRRKTHEREKRRRRQMATPLTATPMYEEAEAILREHTRETPAVNQQSEAAAPPQPSPMAPPTTTNRLYALKRKKSSLSGPSQSSTAPTAKRPTPSGPLVKSEIFDVEEIPEVEIDMSLLGPPPVAESAASGLAASWMPDDYRLFFTIDEEIAEDRVDEAFRCRYQYFKRVSKVRYDNGKYKWFAAFGERGDMNQASWGMDDYSFGSAVIKTVKDDMIDGVKVSKDIQKDKPIVHLSPPSSPPKVAPEPIRKIEPPKNFPPRPFVAPRPLPRNDSGEVMASPGYMVRRQKSSAPSKPTVGQLSKGQQQQLHNRPTIGHSSTTQSQHNRPGPSSAVPFAAPMSIVPMPPNGYCQMPTAPISVDPRQQSKLYAQPQATVKPELPGPSALVLPKLELADVPPAAVELVSILKDKPKMSLNDFPPEYQMAFLRKKKKQEEEELRNGY